MAFGGGEKKKLNKHAKKQPGNGSSSGRQSGEGNWAVVAVPWVLVVVVHGRQCAGTEQLFFRPFLFCLSFLPIRRAYTRAPNSLSLPTFAFLSTISPLQHAHKIFTKQIKSPGISSF